MERKICSYCRKEKPLCDFHRSNDSGDGYQGKCKVCKSNISKRYRKEFPWKKTLLSINDRCNNPKNSRYKNYALRGIKCLITEDELKFLYIRDKAHLMDKPSIDRENNNDHYKLSNCRYIELGINSRKDKLIPIIQLSLDGNLIKEWPSTADAARELKIGKNNINNCLRQIYTMAGNFMWKYKEESRNA